MSGIYPIRWRLVYIDDRQLDELPDGSSISDRWPNPVELQLIDLTGEAVMGLPIPPLHKPIFYRQRSIGQTATGQFTEPRLDATVFGYGRERGSNLDGKLWIWRGGKAVDCPPEHVDRLAIEMMLAS